MVFMEKLLRDIHELELAVGEKLAARLDLPVLHRVVERLASFSECEQCSAYMHELAQIITDLKQAQNLDPSQPLAKSSIAKDLAKKLDEIKTHFKDQHELIQDGYYMSIYMSIGMSVGLLFGLVFLDNLALGLPLGMVFGMAIGMGIDSDAKKKGKVI